MFKYLFFLELKCVGVILIIFNVLVNLVFCGNDLCVGVVFCDNIDRE